MEEVADDASSSSMSHQEDELPGSQFLVRLAANQAGGQAATALLRVWRTDADEDGDASWEIRRSRADLVGLAAALATGQRRDGVIQPPLPPPPVPSASGGGGDSLTDEALERWLLERYLQLVCQHATLGRSPALADFLAPSYQPAVPNQRPHGRWWPVLPFGGGAETSSAGSSSSSSFTSAGSSSVSSSSSSSSASSSSISSSKRVVDVEEFFENERQWAANYAAHLKSVLAAIAAVVQCRQKLAGQQKHLSTALSMNGPMAADDEAAGVAGVETLNRRFQAEMSRSVLELHDAATRTAADQSDGLATWHCVWNMYARYVANEQQMLNRRTALLVGYENANRNWDKAKPAKKDEVEVLKKAAELAFEECSDAARHEIRAFHQQRVSEMRSSLTQLARSELERARHLRRVLERTLERTRQFHIPSA